MIPIRDVIVFPGQSVAFIIGRDRSRLAFQKALGTDRQIAVFTQKDAEIEVPEVADLYPVGTLCRITAHNNEANQQIRVLVTGIDRIKVARVLSSTDYFAIEPSSVIEVSSPDEPRLPTQKQIKSALHLLVEYGPESVRSTKQFVPNDFDELYPTQPGVLADRIAANLTGAAVFAKRLACLAERNPRKRLNLIYEILVAEGHRIEVDHSVKERVTSAIKEKNRVLFLQEELKVILEELGQDTRIALYDPIFRGRGFRIDQELAFALMPFAEAFRPIYEEIIRPVFMQFGIRSVRADDIYGPKAIIEDIWKLINEAKVVIADVTGKNPNVFYEIGIAHAVGKEVIVISQNIEDVPFDLRHLRCIVYKDSVAGFRKFEHDLASSIAAIPGLSKIIPQG